MFSWTNSLGRHHTPHASNNAEDGVSPLLHDLTMEGKALMVSNTDSSFETESIGQDQQSNNHTHPRIDKLFKACCKLGASDLHLKSDSPPRFRIGGDLRIAENSPLSNDQIETMVFEIISEAQQRSLAEEGALDFAYQLPGMDRFRINVYRQRCLISVAARRVTGDVPSFDDLLLPPVLKKVADLREGLVLLAGVTGSGKSTTIAAMINYINARRACHIITIEDPIEYVFADNRALIDQREIGVDVKDFSAALKYLMREDPDVVLLGELRDRDTFEAAINAAETGHLVFGTVHAASSPQAISRILDMFPEDARDQMRQSLVFTLQAIICQKLLPSIHVDKSRVPCCEIMLVNPVIRKLIADQRDADISAVMKNSIEDGMQDFTHAIHELVNREYLSRKTALAFAPNPDELKMRLNGIG